MGAKDVEPPQASFAVAAPVDLLAVEGNEAIVFYRVEGLTEVIKRGIPGRFSFGNKKIKTAITRMAVRRKEQRS